VILLHEIAWVDLLTRAAALAINTTRCHMPTCTCQYVLRIKTTTPIYSLSAFTTSNCHQTSKATKPTPAFHQLVEAYRGEPHKTVSTRATGRSLCWSHQLSRRRYHWPFASANSIYPAPKLPACWWTSEEANYKEVSRTASSGSTRGTSGWHRHRRDLSTDLGTGGEVHRALTCENRVESANG